MHRLIVLLLQRLRMIAATPTLHIDTAIYQEASFGQTKHHCYWEVYSIFGTFTALRDYSGITTSIAS